MKAKQEDVIQARENQIARKIAKAKLDVGQDDNNKDKHARKKQVSFKAVMFMLPAVFNQDVEQFPSGHFHSCQMRKATFLHVEKLFLLVGKET